VPNDNRPHDANFRAEPNNVIGKSFDSILLLRFVAFAVTAKVHSHGAMPAAEIVKLWSETGVIAQATMDQQKGWIALADVLKGENHPASGQLPHDIHPFASTPTTK
jgi:hypothetical protein